MYGDLCADVCAVRYAHPRAQGRNLTLEFRPLKIGKYLLLERIAVGGMAEVYRAKASGAGGFEKQLAIKRILPNYSSNEEFRRMFEYEARLCSMLNHANIAQVYDFVKSGDTYLLAMEFVDGKNLRQFLNKAKRSNAELPIPMALYIIGEVSKGLDYAHRRKDEMTGRPLNIIHRDMSPQNIMISYDGAVKIVDFGIAKAKDRVDETRSGVIKGKFGYMSPEQANGEDVDHRTDIFSNAIILYELLTHSRLFAAENDLQTLKRIQDCVVKRPSLVNSAINEELEKIVLKGLTKSRETRFQNAIDMQRKIQAYLNRHHPEYGQKELGEMMHQIFAQEMAHEKKRIEEVLKQSIPYSQGVHKVSEDKIAEMGLNLIEDEQTLSDHDSITEDTDVEELQREHEAPEEPRDLDSKTRVSIHGTQIELEEPEEKRSSLSTLGAATQKSTSESTLANNSEFLEAPSISEKIEVPKQEDMEIGAAGTGVGESPVERTVQATLDDFEKDPETGSGLLSREAPSFNEEPEPSITKPTSSGAFSPEEPPSLPTESVTADKERSGEIQRLSGAQPMPRRRASEMRTQPPSKRPSKRSIVEPDLGELKSLEVEEMEPAALGEQFFEPRTKTSIRWRRTKEILRSFFLVVLLVGIIFAYDFASKYDVSQFFNLETKVPTKTREITQTEPVATPDLTQVCGLKLDTEPRNAKILINNKVAGYTPTAINVPCKQSVNLTLELEGYEIVRKNIFPDRKVLSLYETLEKIPYGKVRLTLSQGASVEINGQKYKDVEAGQKFEVPLRAGQRYVFRFVNSFYNIDMSRTFVVQKDSVVEESISLDIGNRNK